MSNDFPVPAETAKAPKGSAARLIQVAKSQVGYIEGPKDNETKYVICPVGSHRRHQD